MSDIASMLREQANECRGLEWPSEIRRSIMEIGGLMAAGADEIAALAAKVAEQRELLTAWLTLHDDGDGADADVVRDTRIALADGEKDNV